MSFNNKKEATNIMEFIRLRAKIKSDVDKANKNAV